jgi:large subunit ribosomal protein L10
VFAADRSAARGTTTTEDDVARPDKVAAVEEVKQSLSDSAATLLTHYRGLSVAELQELRAELRKANASYRVIKNTLSKRAMAEAGIDELGDLLEGPTALVFCQEDPVGPAKALKAFAKDHPDLIVRGGYLDGEVLDEAETIKLADLASREELLAELVGLMHGALANTARLLQAPLEQQGRLLQALVDAGGGAEEAPAEEPAASAEEEPAASAEEAPAEEPEAAEASTEEAPAEEPEAAEASTEEEPAEAPEAPEASTEDADEATDADADDDQA